MSSVIFSYLSTVLCSSTTDFVCVGRNLWSPKTDQNYDVQQLGN